MWCISDKRKQLEPPTILFPEDKQLPVKWADGIKLGSQSNIGFLSPISTTWVFCVGLRKLIPNTSTIRLN